MNSDDHRDGRSDERGTRAARRPDRPRLSEPTRQYTCRVPASLDKRIRLYARLMGMSAPAMLVELARYGLLEREQEFDLGRWYKPPLFVEEGEHSDALQRWIPLDE